eukprot:TRINITY_DN21733_c0_g1_i1.p1 TRINITY_DN21733_c0_g1~~TRINITY_DN21733_c0_g1_i1.p1  ORF type:complete len:150 (+),score=20.85 TRINITY_DN21733_c0_g1_i1:164-613(+)
MGKALVSVNNLQNFARVAKEKINGSKSPKPSRSKVQQPKPFKSDQTKLRMESSERRSNNRVPLSEVVSDCVRRWFQDTLKEAKAGDSAMQVLVGQMYYSGYGVPRDIQKGRAWITKASRIRSSVWQVSDKHPGYNASDSDSDELKGDLK